MNAIAFNTHKYVKRLIAAGMPEQQAEAIADEQRALIDDQLATKRDLAEMETGLKRDMTEMETRLKRDMAELETRLKHDIRGIDASLNHKIKEMEHSLTLRLGGMLVVGVGVITALQKNL